MTNSSSARPFYTREHNRDEVDRGILEVGERTYGRLRIHYWKNGQNGRLIVGDYCSIASGVEVFLGGNHRPDWISTYPFNGLQRRWPPASHKRDQPTTKGDVIIGSDVWLGAGCRIMSGINIGHGSVVAASAVVVKDVAPYTIVGGNPAKLLKYRFEVNQIEALLRIRWWDWPEEKVRVYSSDLTSDNLTSFISTHDPLSPSKGIVR